MDEPRPLYKPRKKRLEIPFYIKKKFARIFKEEGFTKASRNKCQQIYQNETNSFISLE